VAHGDSIEIVKSPDGALQNSGSAEKLLFVQMKFLIVPAQSPEALPYIFVQEMFTDPLALIAPQFSQSEAPPKAMMQLVTSELFPIEIASPLRNVPTE
jgi:hypothetical protein